MSNKPIEISEYLKNNVKFTSKEDSFKTYFKIKYNPEVPNDHIYAYFPNENGEYVEKMWICILDIEIGIGFRNSGTGRLTSIPVITEFEVDDSVEFTTDEFDITKAKRITN